MNTGLQYHLCEILMTYECGMGGEKAVGKNCYINVKVFKILRYKENGQAYT
jgi:hypothetical protein